MALKNYTPHTINIYSQEDVEYNSQQRKYFLKDRAIPIFSLPSDGIANAKIDYVPSENIDGVPTYKAVVESVDPVPEEEFCVVSALYVQAAQILGRDTSKLLTISQPVYDNPDNPRPVGCLGLNRN